VAPDLEAQAPSQLARQQVTLWMEPRTRSTTATQEGPLLAQPQVGVRALFFGGPAQSGSRLTIHGAAYADMDVTAKVIALVTPDQVLSLDCKKLNDEFGDPWPENGRKSFSVLYQYGDRPLEVWAGR
jgi:hypothetical protein